MKQIISPWTYSISQSTANIGTMIINKYFRLNHVNRACDLPKDQQDLLFEQLEELKKIPNKYPNSKKYPKYTLWDRIRDGFVRGRVPFCDLTWGSLVVYICMVASIVAILNCVFSLLGYYHIHFLFKK